MTCTKCGSPCTLDLDHERLRLERPSWHVDRMYRCLAAGHTQPMAVCQTKPRELDVRGIASAPRNASGLCSRCGERFALTRRHQKLCDDCRALAFAGRWRRR